MNQEECKEALFKHANIKPIITSTGESSNDLLIPCLLFLHENYLKTLVHLSIYSWAFAIDPIQQYHVTCPS